MKKILKIIINLILPKAKYVKPTRNSLIDSSVPEFVIIGKGVVGAPGSIILAHDASTVIHSNKLRVEKTIIKDDVFIGANAVIMPGITVGKGAIIGAGAIVTKDVADGIVVAGNPAKQLSTVEEYIKKCEIKGVLYSVPQSILNKKGTNLRFTDLELNEQRQSVLKEYNGNN